MASFFTTTPSSIYTTMLSWSSWSLPLVLLHACACLGASFKEVTPPDTMIYSYPIIDVPIGQKITLGMDGGAIEVPTNYHGLGWNMSSSITFPNGSTLVLASTGNMFDTGVSSHCLGSGGILRPTNALVVGAALIPDVAGKYVPHYLFPVQTLTTNVQAYRWLGRSIRHKRRSNYRERNLVRHLSLVAPDVPFQRLVQRCRGSEQHILRGLHHSYDRLPVGTHREILRDGWSTDD